MPDYTPPFTILWTTFSNALPGEGVNATQLYDNTEAIFNIISSSNLTITKYAIVGIATAAYVFSGMNPARVITDGITISVDPVETATAYGLWGSIYDTDYPYGYEQTETVINNIQRGNHYSQYLDPVSIPPIDTPSLSDFLQSGNDSKLGWYWILNYILYRYVRTDRFLSSSFITTCERRYTQLLDYIDNNPRKFNPVALAILAKKKRRWWR